MSGFDEYINAKIRGVNQGPTPQSSVPLLSAPNQYSAQPNTSPVDTAMAAVQKQQQAIAAQQVIDNQAKVAAQQAAQQQPKQHKGGWFGPIKNAYDQVMEYPQQLGAAISNVVQNPMSPLAYGTAALQSVAPIGDILNVPSGYMKMGWGELLYHAAKGDSGWLNAFAAATPGIGPAVQSLSVAIQLGMPDAMKQDVVTSYEGGYKGFDLGSGVWESMMGKTDEWPDPVRIPFRMAMDIANDPLTWLGIGAASEAVKGLAAGSHAVEGATGIARFGDIAAQQAARGVIAADRAARVASAPADQLLFNIPAKVGAKAINATTGDWLLRQSDKTARRNLRRSTGTAVERLADANEGTILGGVTPAIGAPVNTGPGQIIKDRSLPSMSVHRSIGPDGSIVMTMDDAITGKTATVTQRADGTGTRVTTPDNPTPRPVRDIDEALRMVREDLAKKSELPINQVDWQSRGVPAREGNGSGVPPRDLDVRKTQDAAGSITLELDHRTRGSAFAVSNGNTVSLFDGNGQPIGDARNMEDAYFKLKHNLLNQPGNNTLPDGTVVGDAFGVNPQGGRTIDQVAQMDQSDPKVRGFWERYKAEVDTTSPAIAFEEASSKIDTQSFTPRRDLTAEQAAIEPGRGRTLDSPVKALASVNHEIATKQIFRDTFGRDPNPVGRGWQGDPAETLRRFKNKEINASDVPKEMNVVDAIRQAIYDPSEENSVVIREWFHRQGREMLNRDQARNALLLAEDIGEIKPYKGRYRLGDIITKNRDAYQGQFRENIDPFAAAPELTAIPASVPLKEGAPPVDVGPISTDRGDYPVDPFQHPPKPYQPDVSPGLIKPVQTPERVFAETNNFPPTRPTDNPPTGNIGLSESDPQKWNDAVYTFVKKITNDKAAMQQVSGGGETYHVTGDNGPISIVPRRDSETGKTTIHVVSPFGDTDAQVKNIIARSGDTNVVVTTGMPDPIGTPFGFDQPNFNSRPGIDELDQQTVGKGVSFPQKTEPIYDPIYRTWRAGNIGDEEKTLLESVVKIGSGKKEQNIRIGDAYLMYRGESDNMEQAIQKTLKLFDANTMPSMNKGKVSTFFRRYDSYIDSVRQKLMFNPYTGPVAALLDQIGDSARAASLGHVGVAIRNFDPRMLHAGYKEVANKNPGDAETLMRSDGGRFIAALGISEPKSAAILSGREAVDNSSGMFWENMVNKYTGQPKLAKNVQRAAAALGQGGSELIMNVRTGMERARRFTLATDTIVKGLPAAHQDFLNDVEQMAARHPEFSAATFNNTLPVGSAFAPKDVLDAAVDAGLETGDAESLSRKWRSRVNGLEREGDRVSKGVYFSYDQTNADELLRKVFLFHYWYTRASVSYTRTIMNNPYIYVNYQRAMAGLEGMSEGRPKSVKNLIKAFSSPAGYAIWLDPFKVVSTAMGFRQEAYNDGEGSAFDNFVGSSGLFLSPMIQSALAVTGYMQNNNIDPLVTFQTRRIFGTVIQGINAERGGQMLDAPYQDFMNNWVEKSSGLFSSVLPGSKTQYATDPQANDKVLTRNRILDLYEEKFKIEPGTSLDEWSEDQLNQLNTSLDNFDLNLPDPIADQAYKNITHGSLIKLAASLTIPAGVRGRSDTRDARLMAASPAGGASQAARDELNITQAAPGLATDLTISDAQFDANFPANAAGRYEISPTSGLYQSDITSQPGNAAYADYRAWKSSVKSKGVSAFRAEMVRISPSYARYISQLQPDTKNDPSWLDNASISYSAYLASRGDKAQMYDRTPPPSLDPTRVDASSIALGGQVASASSPKGPSSIDDQVSRDLISYIRDQHTFDQMTQQLYGRTIQYDLLPQQQQQAIRDQFRQIGINVPQLGAAGSAYQSWTQVQPRGSDTSIAAYARWVQNGSIGGVNPAVLGSLRGRLPLR